MYEPFIPLVRCFDKHCCLTIYNNHVGDTMPPEVESKCNISSSLFSVFMQSHVFFFQVVFQC